MLASDREKARSPPGTKVPVLRLHCQTIAGRENHHACQGCIGLIDGVHDEVRLLSIEELEAEPDHILLGLLELRNKRANMVGRKAVAV